jgi:hypothetical protein
LARLQARSAVRAVARTLPQATLRHDPEVAGVVFRKPVTLGVTWPVRN